MTSVQHFFENKFSKSALLSIFVLAVFIYFYLSLFENAYIDDTYITLCYVKTLLESHTWGFFPNHIANSATSPLNVIILTIIGFFTKTPEVAIKWFALIDYILLFILLNKISINLLKTQIFGYLAFSALLFNPLLLSTLGLESILFVTLFVASIYFYTEKKWYFLATILALLTITRPDGGLFFIVFLMFVPTVKLRLRFIIVYLLVIAPWYLFSWIYLGSVLPDTFFIKISQKAWGPWDFYNGIVLYYNRFPLETILSFLFLPSLILLLNKNVWKLRYIILIIGISGLAHFAGYSLLHVPPYHWYYTAEIVVIILLGALFLSASYKYATKKWAKKLFGILMLFYFLIPLFGMFYIIKKDAYYIKEMPIHTNWASHEKYKEIGLWLKKHYPQETIDILGEIGTIAYYSNSYLLDLFSDRKWMNKYVAKNTGKKGIKPKILKINLFFMSHSRFPKASYRLMGRTNKKDLNSLKLVKKWNTSSKWHKKGDIVGLIKW